MYAFIPWNPEAAPQWVRALRMVKRGVSPIVIVRKTGIARSTLYARIARERDLNERRPVPGN